MDASLDESAAAAVTFRRAVTVVAYALVGVVTTAVTALALLGLTRPVQRGVYDLFYLHLGPSEATETAVLLHFVTVCLAALGASLVVGDALSDRLAHRAALGRAGAVLAAAVLVFLGVSLAGLASFPTALLVLAAAVVAVPVVLYRGGVQSGGTPALVGGAPVVAVLLLLVGFGLGWGWGYVVTATEVPATNGAAVGDFDAVPAVRDDLFAATNCELGADGRRVCLLSLRGYEHEVAAARFMARHGARCPYQNARAGEAGGSFVARHDGTDYRVTCASHGD